MTIDGKDPGNDRGSDIDASGNGTATATKLYQLVGSLQTSRSATSRSVSSTGAWKPSLSPSAEASKTLQCLCPQC
ncbi:hypothetical protein AJ87_43180 [Rhizobium yanglingense]|nr:hypothetical protein AJ87_43180 [Rhizobium yanglingense]